MRAAQLGRWACVLLVLVTLPAIPAAPIPVAAGRGSGRQATISVVFSRDAAPYREALRGFQEALGSSGVSFVLHALYLDGPLPVARTIDRIREKEPDLILTIGSNATAVVSDHVRDIPIIFSLVLPSSGTSAFRDDPGRGSNLTGSSMEIPHSVQFHELKRVFPGARRIGVLFDPEVTGRVVGEAVLAARKAGLELIPMPVKSESDIAGHRISEVDVLWSVADSTVFSSQGLQQVLLSTLRQRVPFVGLSQSFVKAGALLALSVDYSDVGRQSAELASRVLSGERPEDIRMTTPREVILSVNINTARRIGVEIDDVILRRAEVYGR